MRPEKIRTGTHAGTHTQNRVRPNTFGSIEMAEFACETIEFKANGN